MGLLDFLNTDEARMGISLLGAASPTMQPMGFGERLSLAMRDMDEQKRRRIEEEDRIERIAILRQRAENAMIQQKRQAEYMEKFGTMVGGQAASAQGGSGANWNEMAKMSALGQLEGIDGASGMMEYAKLNRPEWQQVDSGGQIGFVNKNGNQMPVVNKTMTPDAIASNQIAKDNVDIARKNYNKPTYHDGAMISPDGSFQKTPLYVPAKGSSEASESSSKKIAPLLDMADGLLNDATGSYVGTGIDMAAGALGFSTKGAKAGAQLKAVEGGIMMNSPRMEGPQGVLDVQLYRQWAGQIGDSTLPTETRRAAVNGIRKLHEKYSGSDLNKKSTLSGGGWSATEVK